MLPIKKIVCPTDFSEPSIAALDAACELSQHFDAELTIINVIPFTPPLPTDMMVIASSSYYPSDAERREQAQGQIDSLIQKRVPEGVRTVKEIRFGDAPTEITSIAANINADMIVIGTHGETGWRFLALGSVAAKVVRMAHRPVLTVYGGPSLENVQNPNV